MNYETLTTGFVQLSLNVKKTKFALFSPNPKFRTIPLDASIIINGVNLNRIGNDQAEKSIKFLGIHLYQNLTWKYHISTIRAKIARSIFALNRIKKLLPRDILKSLYFSLEQSHLLYGIQAWGSTNFINQLESIQKKAIRIINNKPYNSHTAPLFADNNILQIKDLYQLQAALFAHDYKNGKLPRSFHHYFTQAHHNLNTRRLNFHHLHQSISRTKFSSKLPTHKIPEIWNS